MFRLFTRWPSSKRIPMPILRSSTQPNTLLTYSPRTEICRTACPWALLAVVLTRVYHLFLRSPAHMYIISGKWFPYPPNIDIDSHNDVFAFNINMTWFRLDLPNNHQICLLHWPNVFVTQCILEPVLIIALYRRNIMIYDADQNPRSYMNYILTKIHYDRSVLKHIHNNS